MVDVPRLSVSGYYYIIISTALDLLLFWAKKFTFWEISIKLYSSTLELDISYVADVNILSLISNLNKNCNLFSDSAMIQDT